MTASRRENDLQAGHRDRRGNPIAIVTTRPDDLLVTATVRIPDGSWVSIEPGAGTVAPWGAVDRLWHGETPDARTTALTVFGAVDWSRITTIPPLAEPARLPPGAGTAVLNLLATLAREQGVLHLRYAGPYPTEALFLSLVECFRPASRDGDLLARFMAGDLAWMPAPFSPAFEDIAYVQWRDARIEKVVWKARTYYREDWGTVRRRAPLRVHDDGDRVVCSLWAMGAPLARHLVIAADGVPRAAAPPPRAGGRTRALPRAVQDGLIAVVIAQSAPPLASAVREIAETLTFSIGPLPYDLATVTDVEVRVSSTFAAALARRLRAPAAAESRAYAALAALTELAAAVADPLRLRAQTRLVGAATLEGGEDDQDVARRITAAVAAMLASGGVDDDPDVEGDEADDRDD